MTTLAILALSALGLGTLDDEPVFITEPGTYKICENRVELTIFEEKGKLNTLFKGDLKPGLVSVKPTNPYIEKNGNWFVYPASRLEVWIYPGNDKLWVSTGDRVEGYLLDGRVFICLDDDIKNDFKVPRKVYERLPARVREGLEVAEDFRPFFINEPGKFKLFDGTLTIDVTEENRTLKYTFDDIMKPEGREGIPKPGVPPVLPAIKKGSKWFIYPVSRSEVWIYHGDDDLWVYTRPIFTGKRLSGENHSVFKLPIDCERMPRVPQPVFDRLPLDLQKRLRAK